MSKLSATLAFAQMAVAGLLGLMAVPTLFGGTNDGRLGGPPLPIVAEAWLVAGIGLSIWLLALAPSLASAIAHELARLETREAVVKGQRAAIGAVARLIVAVLDVAIIQGILRRPVVWVLGVAATPSTIDATFAASTLTLLILILIWLHQSARPLVESVAWQALDAIVPTTGSGQSTSFADDADTVLATIPGQTQSGDTASILARSAGAEAPTLAALGGDATRPAPRGPGPDSRDSTIAAVPAEETVADDTATRPAPTSSLLAATSSGDTVASLDREDGTRTSIPQTDETISDGTSTTRPTIADR